MLHDGHHLCISTMINSHQVISVQNICSLSFTCSNKIHASNI